MATKKPKTPKPRKRARTVIEQVPLSAIRPNRYRPEKAPYDPVKIEALIQDIQANGFWPNVLARKHPDHYELAYGHHRVEAARRMGKETVPLLVGDLDDVEMVRALFAENGSEYKKFDARLMVEVVKSAVNFLTAHPGVVKMTLKRRCKSDGAMKTAFAHYCANGPGKGILATFLEWPETRVSEALAISRMISAKDIHRNPRLAALRSEIAAIRSQKREERQGAKPGRKPIPPYERAMQMLNALPNLLLAIPKTKDEKIIGPLEYAIDLALRVAHYHFHMVLGADEEKKAAVEAETMVREREAKERKSKR